MVLMTKNWVFELPPAGGQLLLPADPAHGREQGVEQGSSSFFSLSGSVADPDPD